MHGRSVEETEALVSGVESCGGGKWADIKKLGLQAIEKRSAVDLKDKWRNLQVLVNPPCFLLLPLLAWLHENEGYPASLWAQWAVAARITVELDLQKVILSFVA